MAGVYDLGLELEKLWVVNIWFNCIWINVNWCCLYQIAVSIIVWMDRGYVYLYEKFKLGCTIVRQLILFVFSKLNFWRKVASSIVCFHSIYRNRKTSDMNFSKHIQLQKQYRLFQKQIKSG